MFNAILRFSSKKKLFIGLTTLFLLIGGIYSMLTLPIGAVPDTLCEIVDKSHTLLRLTTYERDLGGMKVGNPVQFRVNRQFLLSREAIKDIDLWFNSRLSINLRCKVTEERVLVNKARVQEFKDWFSNI